MGLECNADGVTADPEGERSAEPTSRGPQIVLCALDEQMALAWRGVADGRSRIRVYQGSILETGVDAVVSPANSFGLMRGGIDAVYSMAWPSIEQRVRSAVLAFHGGELPVGSAVVVPTGVTRPGWLFSAPTMREPATTLPEDTVHPYLAARAVFRPWHGCGRGVAGNVREAGGGGMGRTVRRRGPPGFRLSTPVRQVK
jgi:hypothetical protein